MVRIFCGARGTTHLAVLCLAILVPGFVRPAANAQGIEWTWVGGSSTFGASSICNGGNCGAPGTYGTLGTAAAGNIPGGRESATGWIDGNGNLWLFGGSGLYAAASSQGYFDDLWEFNSSTNEWAWMGGSDTANQPGVYGTLAEPAAGNVPGGRRGAAGWSDKSGNLWLFGGWGLDSAGTTGYLNDLWEFNPSTNEWAWMGGSNTIPADGEGQTGVYGTLGQPAAGNIPGGRHHAAAWTDDSGNLWLFGGLVWGAGGLAGDLNDLWEFNPSTNEWTWMGGSSTVSSQGQPGVYGTLGEPASGNIPGSRYEAVTWTDGSGNLWLFGGDGYDSADRGGVLNDLWEFKPSTGEWTWKSGGSTLTVAGGNVAGLPGVYGTLGLAAAADTPGSRVGPISWTDAGGNFWLFGGDGYDSTDSSCFLDDLWEFNPTTNEWTWQGGSSKISPSLGEPGVYGSLGVPATGNIPGSRQFAAGWTDKKGNLWLFGGDGFDSAGNYGYLNDVWKLSLPVTATPGFSVTAGTYTSAQTVTLSDTTAGSTIYYAINGTPTTSSAVYESPIAVDSSETIEAIAVAPNYVQSAVASAAYIISLPATFTLGAAPITLTASSGGQADTTVTVTPQNGFNSAVTFACSGLPSGASCAFSPASVTPSGAAVTTTLTINAETLTAALGRGSAPLWPGTSLALAVGFFGWRKRRGLRLFMLLAVAVAGSGLLWGCSGGGSSTGGGGGGGSVTSTITVTATSGTIVQTATVTLTVN